MVRACLRPLQRPLPRGFGALMAISAPGPLSLCIISQRFRLHSRKALGPSKGRHTVFSSFTLLGCSLPSSGDTTLILHYHDSRPSIVLSVFFLLSALTLVIPPTITKIIHSLTPPSLSLPTSDSINCHLYPSETPQKRFLICPSLITSGRSAAHTGSQSNLHPPSPYSTPRAQRSLSEALRTPDRHAKPTVFY